MTLDWWPLLCCILMPDIQPGPCSIQAKTVNSDHSFKYDKMTNLLPILTYLPALNRHAKLTYTFNYVSSLTWKNFFWSTVKIIKIEIPENTAALILRWAAAWKIQPKGLCAQRRLGSAWASAQSDQSLRSALRTQAFFMRTAKSPLGRCPDWSESSLDPKVILLFLSRSGLNWNKVVLLQSNRSWRCRWNGKQCQCSQSDLGLQYICPDQSVRKLRIMTVKHLNRYRQPPKEPRGPTLCQNSPSVLQNKLCRFW